MNSINPRLELSRAAHSFFFLAKSKTVFSFPLVMALGTFFHREFWTSGKGYSNVLLAALKEVYLLFTMLASAEERIFCITKMQFCNHIYRL